MVATLGMMLQLKWSTVQKWADECKRGRGGFEDDPRFVCPAKATTQENIDRVHYYGDGLQTFKVNQFIRLCSRNLPRMSWEQTWLVESFSSVGATALRPHQNTPSWSCRRHIWVQVLPFFLNISSPRMSVGYTTSSQRPNNNQCGGNTALLPFQRMPKWCHRQGTWWHPLECKVHCVHWLTSERPNYQWGILCQHVEAAAKGLENGLENWRRESCFNAPAHKLRMYISCAWLWLRTSWSSSIFSWFGTILTVSSLPQYEKDLARKQYRSCNEVISAVQDFF